MADHNSFRFAFEIFWYEQITDNFHTILLAEADAIQLDRFRNLECREFPSSWFEDGWEPWEQRRQLWKAKRRSAPLVLKALMFDETSWFLLLEICINTFLILQESREWQLSKSAWYLLDYFEIFSLVENKQKSAVPDVFNQQEYLSSVYSGSYESRIIGFRPLRNQKPSKPAGPSEGFLFSPKCSRCYRLRQQRFRSCSLPEP